MMERIGRWAPQQADEWAEVLYLAAIVTVPLGIMSLFGAWPVQLEPLVWLAVLALYVLLLLRRERRNKVRLALWTGICVAVLYSTVQALFLPTYVAHNPGLDTSDWDALPTHQMRLLWVIKSPLLGLSYGLLLSVILFAIERRRATQRASFEAKRGNASRRLKGQSDERRS